MFTENHIITLTVAYQEVDLFTEIRGSGANFDAVFGSSETSIPPTSQSITPMRFGIGDILQPEAAGPLASQPAKSPASPRLTNDVDSSLQKAAANLSMSPSTSSISSASSLTSSPWQLTPISPGASPHGVLYTDGGGHVPLTPVNVSPHPRPIDDTNTQGQPWGNLV